MNHSARPSAERSLSFDVLDPVGRPSTSVALEAAVRVAAGRPGALVLAFQYRSGMRLDALTAAERDVMDDVLAGARNAQIALRRGRSVRTIDNQVASVLRKLGLGGRRELASRHGARNGASETYAWRLRTDGEAAALERLPDEWLPEVWHAFLAGHWQFEAPQEEGGARYLVAAPCGRSSTPLTPREQTVCSRVALGESNKVIAYELGVSLSTVAVHLANATRKLRAASRSRLIAVWNALAPLGRAPRPAHLSLVPRSTAWRDSSR